MRAKPISFAQVLKSKNRTQNESQMMPQARTSLAQLVEQFEDSPLEDYTLYLAPVSKAKPTSFRAIGSRGNSSEEIFDSWIQRQSLVNNKENIRLITSKNHLQPSKDQKNMMLTSRERDNREPLKTVGDLVRKIELTESTNPYFKSSSRAHLDKSQEQPLSRSNLRLPRQNQQTSLRNSSQMEGNAPIVQIRLPEKINVQPYIEQPTVVKQPKRREDINDLIAGTQHIHLKIAELAHKMIEEEDQKQMEQSLLIENTEPKAREKASSPSFLHNDEENDLRWQNAKNKVASYLGKLTQEKPKQMATQFKIEITPPSVKNPEPIPSPLEHPGYSFATQEANHSSEEYRIPLEDIKIPQIQEIQSERLFFGEYTHYISCNNPSQNSCVPTKVQELQVSPEQRQIEMRSPEFEMSAKRINSSLVFSQNAKDTPSPEAKAEQARGGQSGSEHHVTLSFTEEKPEIVINIPLDYAEAADQFQMETVEVRQECIETPFSNASSSDKQESNEKRPKQDKMSELQEQIMTQQSHPLFYQAYAKQHQEYACMNEERIEDQELQLESQVAKIYNQQQSKVQENNCISPYEKWVPLVINEVIEIPNAQKGLGEKWQTKLPKDDKPFILSYKIEEKKSTPLISTQLQSTSNMGMDFNSPPAELPAEPIIQPTVNKKSSGSKESGKGSPSIFGLKKIYSSPKTVPIITPPPIVTSAFTTNLEKPKTEPVDLKGAFVSKSFERSAKIEPYAYTNSFARKKEEAKIVQEENQEFQFDF